MSKGHQTRDTILDKAVDLASQVGLEGLNIGPLATSIGMSKSGLIAHFGSKEKLQVATLQHAQQRFQEAVIAPALAQPRGLARIRALFEHWLAWLKDNSQPGGCVMLGAVTEYDDRPGAVRETVSAGFRELRGAIAKAVRIAMDEGHFRADADPWQFAFELLGIVLASAHEWRLHADPRTAEHARAAFERLLGQYQASPLKPIAADYLATLHMRGQHP